MTDPNDSAEGVARAFLAALDERRWRDAASLVDPRTRVRFRTWWIEQLENGIGDPAGSGGSDTHFSSPAALLGMVSSRAAALTDTELLARFAEAVQPWNVHRHLSVGISSAGDEVIRITRTLAGLALSAPEWATVRYHTEWWHGGARNEATTGMHVLELARTSAGWRVHDADLGGGGGGHILPPAG